MLSTCEESHLTLGTNEVESTYQVPFPRTCTCQQGRRINLLVKPDISDMTRRAAASSTSISVHLQVQTLGHAALGKQK